MLNHCALAIYLQISSDDKTSLVILLGIVILITLFILIVVAISNQLIRELTQAREEYQASLAQLKSNSTNADLKQRTLELGRIYANLTRQKKGVALFDEIALMNDINAACAGASIVYQPQTATPSTPSIEARLARLSDLQSKGLIDKQEYSLRRQRIIDEV